MSAEERRLWIWLWVHENLRRVRAIRLERNGPEPLSPHWLP